MFKGTKKYVFVFAGLFALIILVQYLLPQPVNWRRTYTAKDKIPYGCQALYQLLEGTFCAELKKNKQTLYNLKNNSDSSSVIIINEEISFNKNDLRSMFELLNKGNTVFLSANNFNGALADTFHLRSSFLYFEFFNSIDSVINKKGSELFLTASNYREKQFQYSRAARISAFSNFDSTIFKIKAVAGKEKKACVLEARIGKGKLILVNAPDIFTNYFIVNHPNRELAYALLSSAKNKTILWDEFYNPNFVSHDSFLKLLLEDDALYSAWLLFLFTIIIYMITEGRRRQRAIPVIEPVTNTTLEFVDVITHVYYSNKNHQDIASEKIKYFYENVRKKFNVSTNDINDGFCKEISDLSGIEFKTVKQLFSYCEKLKTTNELSEYDLIELNRQISNFNKNSLR